MYYMYIYAHTCLFMYVANQNKQNWRILRDFLAGGRSARAARGPLNNYLRAKSAELAISFVNFIDKK